jgi:hypothetical protein
MDHAPVPLAPGTHRRRFPPGRRRVGPLALSAGVFRAGFLGERVQDRVQRGGALRGQITFHPARAMQRAVQPQPPIREPIISVGVGLGGQAACPADRAGGRAAGDPGLPPKHARAEPCPSSSQPLQEMNAANAPARAAVCSDSARSNPRRHSACAAAGSDAISADARYASPACAIATASAALTGTAPAPAAAGGSGWLAGQAHRGRHLLIRIYVHTLISGSDKTGQCQPYCSRKFAVRDRERGAAAAGRAPFCSAAKPRGSGR